MKILYLILALPLMALAVDDAFCPVPDLAHLNPFSEDPDWPIELIKINKHEYKKNHQASFCTRPVEMIDTIVIHHSETPATSTPDDLNELHLNRGGTEDPWYMIGYSYVINSPYDGNSTPSPVVTEGRPLDLVGSHAGSFAFAKMDDEEARLWAEGKIVCGKEGEEFKVDPKIVQGNKIKANVTTIGVVVAGNYAPFSKDNPGGYSRRNPRYPTKQTLNMLARLSCQLQKKYPRIKNLKWHSFYHDTSCPGNLKLYIGQIKAMAQGFGCEFN